MADAFPRSVGRSETAWQADSWVKLPDAAGDLKRRALAGPTPTLCQLRFTFWKPELTFPPNHIRPTGQAPARFSPSSFTMSSEELRPHGALRTPGTDGHVCHDPVQGPPAARPGASACPYRTVPDDPGDVGGHRRWDRPERGDPNVRQPPSSPPSQAPQRTPPAPRCRSSVRCGSWFQRTRSRRETSEAPRLP